MNVARQRVLVTGGAGYVGSSLVPKLLAEGHEVKVLDLYLYGDDIFEGCRDLHMLRGIKGDIRDPSMVAGAMRDVDTVIHLACISNDPSYDLDPDLGKSINFDAFRPMVRAAKDAGVKRFVYASSSSVYGIKADDEVTEELALEPLTDYSKFKALCEDVLHEEREAGFATCIIRPSTVCGYAPRQRLDVIVNILTNHAVNTGRIKVFGGEQKRPNIHIDDMTDLYVYLLNQPSERIDGEVFNAGDENHTVNELAALVRGVIGDHLEVDVEPTPDPRSYHVSSKKMRQKLGFETSHTIADAVQDLAEALGDGRLVDPMENPLYFNIKRMKQVDLA